MKKFFLALMASFLMAGTVAMIAPAAPASAAGPDRRACVTRAEYRMVHFGQTTTQVARILDGWGYLVDWNDSGYYEGGWVNDGYWTSSYDGWDWYDEWVDLSYYDEYWVPEIDTVRSYPKCSGFGRGRVGINFDNYTHARSGMRVYTKVASNPRQLIDLYSWSSMRATARSVVPEADDSTHKVIPQSEGRAPKPDFAPLTPDPHPSK